MDRKQKAVKELFCEADFYNIQPLVDEISVAIIVPAAQAKVTRRTETVIVSWNEKSKILLGGSQSCYFGTIKISDTRGNYEVLKELIRKCLKMFNMVADPTNSIYYINKKKDSAAIWNGIQSTLRSLGFAQKSDENGNWKFTRNIRI